jgi:hypothetical protein
VVWNPVKSAWITGLWTVGLVGGYMTASPDCVAVFATTSAVTLCGGHSLGMHRKLIHDSFECPVWLTRVGVWLGTLVGLAGQCRSLGSVASGWGREWERRGEGKGNTLARAEKPTPSSPPPSLHHDPPPPTPLPAMALAQAPLA